MCTSDAFWFGSISPQRSSRSPNDLIELILLLIKVCNYEVYSPCWVDRENKSVCAASRAESLSASRRLRVDLETLMAHHSRSNLVRNQCSVKQDFDFVPFQVVLLKWTLTQYLQHSHRQSSGRALQYSFCSLGIWCPTAPLRYPFFRRFMEEKVECLLIKSLLQTTLVSFLLQEAMPPA